VDGNDGARKGRLYTVAEMANSNGKAEYTNNDTSDKEAFQDGLPARFAWVVYWIGIYFCAQEE
jgi:hypothetical protein